MSRLEDQFAEDRALRDASKAVLMADIEHAKASFSAKGLADRVGSRIGDGAVDVFEQSKEKVGKNGGIIAGLIGLLVLWLGREPLMEAVDRLINKVDEEIDAEEAPLAEDKQATDIGTEDGAAPSPETPGDENEQ